MRVVTGFVLTLVAASIAACGGAVARVDADGSDGATGDGRTGVAALALTVAPFDVACVRVVVTGATRTAERRLDASTGGVLHATLDRLPTGAVLVAGDAFAVDCSAIDGATPSWTAAPVSTTLDSDSVAAVELVFSPH